VLTPLPLIGFTVPLSFLNDSTSELIGLVEEEGAFTGLMFLVPFSCANAPEKANKIDAVINIFFILFILNSGAI
jgi:hypothetical protein